MTTKFTYDSSKRVTSITQTVTSAGGPGDSITRLAHPSATQTLVPDPTTNQALAVSVVPHASYTLDATQRVTAVVVAAGRVRSETYTAKFDTATATRGSSTGSSTTTYGYNANNGESLSCTSAPTGPGSAAGAGSTSRVPAATRGFAQRHSRKSGSALASGHFRSRRDTDRFS